METVYLYDYLDMLHGTLLASDTLFHHLPLKENDTAYSVFKILGRGGWEMCGCYQHNDLLVRFWFKKSNPVNEA